MWVDNTDAPAPFSRQKKWLIFFHTLGQCHIASYRGVLTWEKRKRVFKKRRGGERMGACLLAFDPILYMSSTLALSQASRIPLHACWWQFQPCFEFRWNLGKLLRPARRRFSPRSALRAICICEICVYLNTYTRIKKSVLYDTDFGGAKRTLIDVSLYM